MFPPTDEHPLRVEFFGDQIDEIHVFAVADQRTLQPVDRLWAPPCRESCDRRRTPTRGRARHRAPAARRDHRQARPGDGRRGHGVALARTGRGDGAARRAVATREPRPRAGSRTRTHPSTRPRRHQRGVPRCELGRRRSGGTAPIDLGAASLRGIADVRTQVLEQGQAWRGISPFGLDTDVATLTDLAPGSPETRLVGAQPAEPIGATSRPWSPTSAATSPPASGSAWPMHQGLGLATSMVEVLGERELQARLVEDSVSTGSTEQTDYSGPRCGRGRRPCTGQSAAVSPRTGWSSTIQEL